MASCAICTMHVEMRSVGFLVEPQNQDQWFVSGLASKPLGWFVSGLTLKSLGWFVSGLVSKSLGWFDLKTTRTVSHRFESQNRWRRFVSGLTSKPLGRFSPVWPQNW
jgi:hypothetical protein